MNVEIGAEATLFPEKEYINGVAVAVWTVEYGGCVQNNVYNPRYSLSVAIGFYESFMCFSYIRTADRDKTVILV
jgi:hypothetical protein